MIAQRLILDRSQLAGISIPDEFGTRLEVIIMPASEELEWSQPSSEELSRAQAGSGMMREYLKDEGEDW